MVPVHLSPCALRASTVAVFFLPLTYGIKKYGNRERRSVVWDKSLRQAFPPLGKLDFWRRQSAWLRVCVWFACSVSGFEIERYGRCWLRPGVHSPTLSPAVICLVGG